MEVISFIKRLKKPLLLSLASFFLLGSFAYGQIQSDRALVIETLHVFPNEIFSDDWENVETVVNQNLDGYALYQDFNTINSAFVSADAVSSAPISEPEEVDELIGDDEPSSVNNDGADEPVDASTSLEDELLAGDTQATASIESSGSTTTVDSGDVVDDSASEEVLVEPEAPVVSAEEEQSEVAPVDQVEAPVLEGEVPAPGPVSRLITPFALAFETFTTRLPFVNESTTSTAASTIATSTEVTEEERVILPIESEGLPVVDLEEVVVDVSVEAETVATSSVEAVIGEGIPFVPPIPDEIEPTDQVATTTLSVDSEESGTPTTPTPAPAAPLPTIESCGDNCGRYVMEMTGFGMPIFDDELGLDGGQLRVSLAAQKKTTRLDEEARYVVEYSYDNGVTWGNGGVVDIIDEVSNSINGGHFLFALPSLTDPELLDRLSIRIVYEGSPETVRNVFVESAWLELFTVSSSQAEIENPFTLFEDNFVAGKLTGDELVLPSGEEIVFDFTDENSNETLIIKSDDVLYEGLSKATMYFNVTNESNRPDSFNVKTYFPASKGEVTDLAEWSPNKPREITVPEYRPYVYHCEGGWESTEAQAFGSVLDFSRQFGSSTVTEQAIAPYIEEMEAVEAAADEEEAQTEEAQVVEGETFDDVADVVETESTEAIAEPEVEAAVPPNEAPAPVEDEDVVDVLFDEDTNIQTIINAAADFMQATVIASSSAGTSTEELIEVTTNYICRNTSIVRTCDAIGEDSTECRQESVKVKDHVQTVYRGGWDDAEVATSTGRIGDNRLTRAASLFGLAPRVKNIPDDFVSKTVTPEQFSIAAGETKYFKMDISFPALSSGEFWIEAIGNREYGLLDPFWQSSWRYRKPISVDNTLNAAVVEQQVFIELGAAESDFWGNVNADGGDIRFVRETPGNDINWWNTGWASRMAITIPASEVDENLTDFPVYVDLNTLGSDFFTNVQANGADIRVTDSAETPIEMPIDLVSISTGGETGELHFEAASLSSTTDSVFYIYYDNGDATGYATGDTYGSEAVWGNSFDVRYALDDDPASNGQQLDSTSNGADATSRTGMTSGDVVAGQVGSAINHDGNDGADFNTGLAYAGEFTASMWWRSSGDGFAISIVSGSGAKFGPWNSGNTFVRVVSSSDQTISSPADGTWAHVTLTRDSSNKVDYYIDGVPNRMFSDAAQSGSTQWDNMGGQSGQAFRGDIDELRFASVKRSDGWVSTEYNNQFDPTAFYSTSTAESITFSTFTELDHWTQHFDYAGNEADIWVQVDTLEAAASTTIHLYYGNTGAVSTSDEFAPFTYSTSTPLYHVVNGSESGTINVYSLIDGNEVSIDGLSAVPLDRGELTTFATFTASSTVSSLGPISTRSANAASEPLAPISFATTTHILTTNRGSEVTYVYSPFADADVEVYEGSDLVPSANGTSTVLAGEADSYNVDFDTANNWGIVESTEPILIYLNETSDGTISYPPTLRDLYGFMSNQYMYGTIGPTTSVEIFCSSGTTGTTTGMIRGLEEADDFCSNGSQGTGDAVRLANATNPIGATQEADSDGGESTRFLPAPEFGTLYIIPQTAEYVSVACAPRFGDVDIEIQDSIGGFVASSTCTPGAEVPGAVNFASGGGPYSQGYSVISTNSKPFYMYYEDAPSETNIWGSVQAKKYNSLYYAYDVGVEEENTDAEYEQNSYGWYENADSATPGASWPLDDGELADEGEAISGTNAVNPGDVMRLRMNLLANNGTGTVDSTAFRLQYTEAITCETVLESSWADVADIGSTTAAFAGFNNASPADGIAVPTLLLSSSTVAASYEEENTSATLPNEVGNGEYAEFDWTITTVAPVVNSEYCFRMVRAGGTELTTYTLFPELLTAGPPEAVALLSPFDNEHATSTLPDFRFVTADVGGDVLDYEIDIASDADFGSIILSRDSDSNPFEFENVSDSSDKAPFFNGQEVRFLPASALTNGQTYWWRVRAIDPEGSNTYGDYSTARSFTVNTAVTLSEWFQTTDDQFETNSLSSATTSGSGSLEPDIGGSPTIGEYGSVEMTNGATSSVSLTYTYTDPVVVASIRYAKSVPDGDQPSARVFNKTATGFDVFTDNYTFDAPGTSTIDYIVMEAGEYLMDDGADGQRVYATSTVVSTIVGSNVPDDPGGLAITFPTSFSNPPAVLTMVTTLNDPQWVVSSVYDGNDKDNPPTASDVTIYLNDNIASDGHTSSEGVDLIAFDIAAGTNDGVAFNSLTSAEVITHVPVTLAFATAFATAPQTTVVQQLTMNGAQGSYAMVDVDTPVTTTGITLAAEEGGTGGARGHAAEAIAVVAFENATGTILRAGNAQVVSTVVDYDDVVVGNAWGEVTWSDAGDVTYRVQYQTGGGFQNIPDSDLLGNDAGFTGTSINILNLDTAVYNQLRLTANLSGVGPEIFDWTIKWGQRVETPELGDPFDNEKTVDTTPTFDFSTVDPDDDRLEYEISISTDPAFTSSTTINSSSTPADFDNLTSGGDSNPFISGDTITYTVPPGSALTDGETYWWRVRAKDSLAGQSFSPWSMADNFTVDTGVGISTWFQTTQAQFQEGVLDGAVASTSNSVELSNEIGEYDTIELTDNAWTTINTELTYNTMVVVASPEYDYDEGVLNGRTPQVRNKTRTSFEIKVENTSLSLSGTTTVHYMAMEAGDWTIADETGGTRILAGIAADVADRDGSSIGYTGGTDINFVPDFGLTPAVFATVSTNNGSKWVATTLDDGSQTGEVGSSSMNIALGIGLDTDTDRVAEDIDYIVADMATGTNNGVLFDSFNSPDAITPDEIIAPFNQTFSGAPGVILTHNNANDGGDGGFSLVDPTIARTASEVYLSIAELPGNVGHSPEIVSVLAFESASGTILRDATVGGGLAGTISSEPVLFSDGLGPKFDRAIFASTTPGASTVSLQVEYQTATGTWALLPDGQVPSNSAGNLLSPVDLTGIDVGIYPVIRLVATLSCDGVDCPSLDEWAVEWSEGVSLTGNLKGYDRVTNTNNATITVSVNGGLPTQTDITDVNGDFTLDNVTAFAGDTVTVFVDDVPDANEAVSAFIYDGLGDMTSVQLYEQHLTLFADEKATSTIVDLARSDFSSIGDEDVFFDVASGDLTVCAVGVCPNANFFIGTGNIFEVATSSSQTLVAHDFVNDGTAILGSSMLELSGSWDNNSVITTDTSAVTFTATDGNETLTDVSGTVVFYDVTFGQGSGTTTWDVATTIDIGNDLAVSFGTLERNTAPVLIGGGLTNGAAGFWSGIGTTTFDGGGLDTWTDSNASPQNIGHMVVDGSSKTVLVGSDVRAETIFIGANDTLNAGGAYDLFINGNFTNTNTFLPQTSQLIIEGTSTNAFITTGGASFYGLQASTSAGSVSFTESSVTVLDTVLIATGTINLPTDTFTVGGSFVNNGGMFTHNNGTVTFVSSGTETITLAGTTFFNSLYNANFTGSGDWAFLDTNATTTNTFTVSSGEVTFPPGQLTVGAQFATSGGGSFEANGGEVVFLVQGSDTITTNSSAFNDVRFVQGDPARGGSFDSAWLYRNAIVIDSTEIDAELTDFPVYVDLSDLDSSFFTDVNTDGGDIRITQSDGLTEVPREIVSINTVGETGELYFKAATLASTTNTTFYIYYGNAVAVDYAIDATNGAENVWDADFLAVYHMESEDAIDSTSFDRDATGVGSPATTTGFIGTGVSIVDSGGDDYIDLSSNLSELDGGSEMTISTWVNVTEDAGDDVLFATQNASPILIWDNISGTTDNDTYTLSVGSTGGGNRVDGAPTGVSVGDTWQYMSASMQSAVRNMYVDGTLSNSVSSGVTTIPTNSGGSNIGRWLGSFDFGGIVDEFRISAVERSAEWVAAEYSNMNASTGFYTISSGAGNPSRIFADSNVTVEGDLVIESAGVQFPTADLAIGGSFDNDGFFTSGGGAVSFVATTTGNTIAAGTSTFATLNVNGTGEWNVTENATATEAINLVAGNSFIVDPGIIIESTSLFTNVMASTSTTWTGATLKLSSGGAVVVNATTDEGDVYDTILTTTDTKVSWWNSSASTYTLGTSSSVYSMDHAAADGALNIYGEYERTTGTEYWSYATDWDGTDLTGGSERIAAVQVENGGRVTIDSASLSVVGLDTASTTIDAISGSYAWVLDEATLTLNNAEITGGDAAGMQLFASTTIAAFTDTTFTIPAASAAITLSSTTVDTNPDTQYFGINFVSGSGDTNVDLMGTPVAFWWFRDGAGDRYGEANDNNDGDPGQVRWDDSSFLITVSGVVYESDRATALTGPTCDGSTANVRVVVDGGAYTDTASCDGITGAYEFLSNVAFVGDPVIHVYLDTNGASNAVTVTKTPTADITDFNLYENHVTVRHEDSVSLTSADLSVYAFSDDADLPYSVATTGPAILTTYPDTALFVEDGYTFAPESEVILIASGSASAYDGSLYLGAGATFTATGTTQYTIGGGLAAASGGVLQTASSTFVFNASTTSRQIIASSTLSFYGLQFNGAAGGWNIDSAVVVATDVDVTAGTVSGAGDITVTNGSLAGNGVVSMTGGTVLLEQTNTLGGVNSWTFNNLTLGNGSVAGVTTPASSATTTIINTLTIAPSHFLDAGNSNWELTGSGTVFVENGQLLEDTSTVQYSGSTPSVLQTTYYNLVIDSDTGPVTATAPTTGLQVLNELSIGGQNTATLDLNTNDPVTSVGQFVTIGASGTLLASDVSLFQVAGDWDNDGTFTANGGSVTFSRATGTASIAAGASPFANLSITGIAPTTVTESATATESMTIGSANTFILASGLTLAVGGEFSNETNGVKTTWTNTTLSLYGGDAYEISTKTLGDTYHDIDVGANTHPRLWNSTFNSVATAANGSLYSMDHDDVAGELYVFGDYINNSFGDYWSYATDFDGVGLGGSSRAVDVYIASGGGVNYQGGSALYVNGSSSASTTVQNQGSGNYSIAIEGTATTSWEYAEPRNMDAAGISFTGTPSVTNFDNLDFLVQEISGTAVTVDGTVVNSNPAKNFDRVGFSPDTGITGTTNVVFTGSAVSSWRFVNSYGTTDGEAFDSDSGDPGEIVWPDSASLITVSGNVYSNEGSTASLVCDGSTLNVYLRIAGLATASTTCNAVTGAYSIPGVIFSAADTLTLYISGETEKATTVSVDPVSNITDMDLYENRVIVRHESASPLSIAEMAVWDSTDDADILFTAVDAGSDTLSLPSNTKLIIWNNKEFEPEGEITLNGGGTGDAVDGTFEAYAGAIFTANNSEAHTIDGSVIFGAGANFVAASSTFILTSTAGGRTIDINNNPFYNVQLTGSGAWSITDSEFTVGGDFEKSAGTLTFPTGTTTVGGDFDNSGGTFVINGSPLILTATDGGNTIALSGSDLVSLSIVNGGSYAISDTNATTTASVRVESGTLTLPSGVLAVGGNFYNDPAATVTHNSGILRMTSDGGAATITQGGDDLNTLIIEGSSDFVMVDGAATLRGDLLANAGTLITPTSTLSIGGSFIATSSTVTVGTSTLLFNAATAGHTIAPGTNDLYNVVIAGASGEWTLLNATTTNNFSLVSANDFIVASGDSLAVGGVFSNTVAGANTTWTGSTLTLYSGLQYTVNTKSTGADSYDTLVLLNGTDARFWNSNFVTTTLSSAASIYSQDHGASNGALQIYGDFQIATTSEYWSYARDFDGTTLSGGSRRQVNVAFVDATGASSTMTSGSLEIVGVSTATTTISTVGAGVHGFDILGGTLNADYYLFDALGTNGVVIDNAPTITSLDNGAFSQAIADSAMITLDLGALNVNPGLVISNTNFAANGLANGINVNLSATGTNSWIFVDHSGDLSGEFYDLDGVDLCGSIRWDDSDCLLLEQTNYRWRNDDGGLGAPADEWFDTDWDKRQRVRVENGVNETYSDVAVELSVTYDADMQSNFDDIRFTDASGTTSVPYWVETFTSGVSAQVWVQVETLPAQDTATLFMYYDNVFAASLSSSTQVFTAADDFESASLTDYSGDTFYEAGTVNVYGGAYGAEPSSGNLGNRAASGIARFDRTMSPDEIIRYRQFVDVTNGSDDETCTLFAVQSPVTAHNNYGVCIEQFGTDRISLVENAESTDSYGSVTVLSSTTVTYVDGWYEVVVDWQTGGQMDVSLFNPSGTLVATTSASDSSHGAGGFGFTSWGQNGGWDSIVSYPRMAAIPSAIFGAEQTDGGATWAAAQNTAVGSVILGQPIRLRFSVDNTGIDLTGQEFLVESAPKGAAPTCESVPVIDFTAVPNVAGCGVSDICMATSSNIVNNEATTDLLFDTTGTFAAGQAIESPSNKTSAFDLDQFRYTEIEFVLTPTINVADDAYCFRITNDGTELDAYAVTAEMSLEFAPTLGAINFNEGTTVTLSIGTTTEIFASTTVSDLNGFADLTSATTTFYRSDVAGLADCTEDDNNCYRTTTADSCSFSSCAGNSCSLICTADFAFHTDPTDLEGGIFWYAYTEVADGGTLSDFATSPANDVGTLRALDVEDEIGYGAVGVNDDSGAFNPQTTLVNLGNEAIDVQVQGTDLTDGAVSIIDAEEQLFATSTFTYSSCTFCSSLTEVGSNMEVDLLKPTVSSPAVTDLLYWGIFVPFGTNSAAHSGINTFIATGD